MFTENRRIGIGLCGLGLLFLFLGVLFLFDRIFLCFANISFLLGIIFLLGPYNTIRFFIKRNKLKGSFFFFSGLTIIILRWPFFGVLFQIYGVWILFNTLLPNILGSLKLTPIGFIFELPGLKQISTWIYNQRRLPY